MAEFVDSPVAAQNFPYPAVVETSVDINHEELISTDARLCARLDVPGSRRLSSSRLDLNRTVLDDSTPDAWQNLGTARPTLVCTPHPLLLFLRSYHQSPSPPGQSCSPLSLSSTSRSTRK